jgi:aminoglycoside/choline kinase family phosphotransferase
MPDRCVAIDTFLVNNGWGDAAREALAGDASFRRYIRLRRGDETAMLMDAPPPEDVRPFRRIARLLHGLGFSAPEVRAADAAAGLLLLEDLGEETYTRVLASGGDEASLYTLATDVLIELHRRFQLAAMADDIPPYDDTRLLDEAALLVDWYLPAMRGEPTDPVLRNEYLGLWAETFALARRAGLTLVLRDYHVDNLILLDGREGVGACGLLDFQDAVIGPAGYDLVSLLEDARRDVPEDLAARMIARYLDAFPAMDRDGFMASYAVMGAQRSAKIVGIFTRLDRRDGKPVYLEHIPRVWRWLEGDLAHPALVDLRDWFDREIPPAYRRMPDAKGMT